MKSASDVFIPTDEFFDLGEPIDVIFCTPAGAALMQRAFRVLARRVPAGATSALPAGITARPIGIVHKRRWATERAAMKQQRSAPRASAPHTTP